LEEEELFISTTDRVREAVGRGGEKDGIGKYSRHKTHLLHRNEAKWSPIPQPSRQFDLYGLASSIMCSIGGTHFDVTPDTGCISLSFVLCRSG
jgi:hypothetical protein